MDAVLSQISHRFHLKAAVWFALTSALQIGVWMLFQIERLDLRHGKFWFIAPFILASAWAMGSGIKDLEEESFQNMGFLSVKGLFYGFGGTGLTYLFLDINCSTCIFSTIFSTTHFLIFMAKGVVLSLSALPISLLSAYLYSRK